MAKHANWTVRRLDLRLAQLEDHFVTWWLRSEAAEAVAAAG